MAKVTIAGEEHLVSEFSGRKAFRALRIIRSIADAWPELLEEMARFTRDYERDNVIEISRADARRQFPPQPIIDQLVIRDDEGEVLRTEDGTVAVEARIRTVDGKPDSPVVYGLDPLGHLSDEDWEQSGNKLELKQSPSFREQLFAVFPLAFDKAEEQLLELIALALTNSEDIEKAHRAGGADQVAEILRDRADELLGKPGAAADLLEAAVVAAEVVEQQFRSKLDQLGERTGKLLGLFGLGKKTEESPSQETQTTGSSSERPTSSTDSAEPTDGTSEPPSTELAGASSSGSSAA